MDFSVINFALVVKLLLLLLIGMGPKIALVPFLEKTKHFDAETQRAVGRQMVVTAGGHRRLFGRRPVPFAGVPSSGHPFLRARVWRKDRGVGESSPVYVVGLVTFLIMLGLGLAPLPTDSGSIFISRVLNVIIAAVYTIGMASVLRSLFRARVGSASSVL